MANHDTTERRIDIFRHSIAAPFVTNMTHAEDFRRKLTVEGIKLADERWAKLGHPDYDVVLFSTAARCQQTALGMCSMTEVPVLLQMKELAYDGKDTPAGRALSEMFSKLGQANLKAYNHLDVQGLIEVRARLAWAKVWQTVVECDAKRTLVVGHNIFINAMGYIATYDEENPNSCRSCVFETAEIGECEGYSLFFKGKVVTGVELYRSGVEKF
jgi:broad specificity phosphatase PhoE